MADTVSDDEYWAARSQRTTTEIFMLYAAHGMSMDTLAGRGWSVSADPTEPDDNNPDEPREYFVTAPVLEHGAHGVVTGVGSRTYRVTLERVS